MLAIPDTWPHDLAAFPSDLSMPYTLTPGRAVWREGEPTGSLSDISHFEVIDGAE